MTTTKRKEEIPVLLNFLPLSDGGGLQNALSFIETLVDNEPLRRNLQALVRHNSLIHGKCQKVGLRSIVVPNGRIGRLQFELTSRLRFRRGQVCFTLFGPVMMSSAGYLMNIVGCAYANLFYPEIDFWSYLPMRQRMVALANDSMRRRFSSGADYWIFETNVLRQRAVTLCGFPESRVAVVPMGVSSLVSPARVCMATKAELQSRLGCGFKFLFLNGTNPNKRIHLLPSLAMQMKEAGATDFVFITTMSREASYTRDIMARFRVMRLAQHFQNLGPVAPDKVSSLIACVDAMCTFSRLESFSNNFVEAWTMQAPLIVTSSDWARGACGPAALYVNPENFLHCAAVLKRLMDDAHLRKRLVARGRLQLRRYPTSQERTSLFFKQIECACALGPCGEHLKTRIRWPRPVGQAFNGLPHVTSD